MPTGNGLRRNLKPLNYQAHSPLKEAVLDFMSEKLENWKEIQPFVTQIGFWRKQSISNLTTKAKISSVEKPCMRNREVPFDPREWTTDTE